MISSASRLNPLQSLTQQGRVAVILSLVSVIFASGCSEETTAEVTAETIPVIVEKGRVYESTCMACHGAAGEGNRDLASPSIAGLPVWYVKLQIEKFQLGYRGTHPEDIHGQQMRAIALLLDDETTTQAAEKIAAMPKILTTSTDPEPVTPLEFAKAKKVFADSCMNCHRFNGTGERVFRSAPLIGLQDWYQAAQLKKYRDGLRGANRDDLDGTKMAKVAVELDDREIQVMANYLAALAQGDDPREVMDR